MAQENIEFKTTTGEHTAVLRPFITRKHRRQINNALFAGKEFKVQQGKEPEASVSMDETQNAEDKTIEIMLISLDGSEENMLDRYLELPDNEAAEIKAKIDEITKPVEAEKKDAGRRTTTK